MKRYHLKNIIGLSPCDVTILPTVLSYKFPIKKVPEYEKLLTNVFNQDREKAELLSLSFNNRSGQYYSGYNMPYLSMNIVDKNNIYLGYVDPFYRGRNLSNETDENREIYREIYDAFGGIKALLNYSDIHPFIECLIDKGLNSLFFSAKRLLLDVPKSNKYSVLFRSFYTEDMVSLIFDEFTRKHKGNLLKIFASYNNFFEVCNTSSMFNSSCYFENEAQPLSFTQYWSIEKYNLKPIINDAFAMLKAEDYRLKKLLGLVA